MTLTIKDTNLSTANARAESAAPTELLFFVYVFTQGSVRAFGTLATLGFAGVSPLQGSVGFQRLRQFFSFSNENF